MKNCANCSKPIAPTRRKNAKYCSDLCYRQAKNARGAKRYLEMSSRHSKVLKNLRLLTPFVDLDEPVPISYLHKKGFDWDVYDRAYDSGNGHGIVKSICNFAYQIETHNNHKYVRVWTLQN